MIGSYTAPGGTVETGFTERIGVYTSGVLAGYFIDYTDPNATNRIFEAIGSTSRSFHCP